jgi:hypothetical protein
MQFIKDCAFLALQLFNVALFCGAIYAFTAFFLAATP